jgi:hypothetical protein
MRVTRALLQVYGRAKDSIRSGPSARLIGGVACGATLILAAGCSGKTAPMGSGFLGDDSVYSALKPHPKYEGVMVTNYEDPSYLRGAKFIIPPAKIYLSQSGQERNIDKDDLAELAMYFRNQMISALEDKYTITHVPGPHVYTLKLALTDADPNIPLLNVHPGTVISGVGLGGATIEMAIEDSDSGKLMSAITAKRHGKRYKYIAGLTKWGHTKEVLEDFSSDVRSRLDEITADKSEVK